MRKTLLSVSLIVATGATLVAGGAFSVFNDTKTATGTYSTGSVVLDLGTNTLTLTTCTPSYSSGTLVPALNMGSVNNNVCTSTVAVTNKGTLPMRLLAVGSGSSVADAITLVGSSAVPTTTGCFTSVINPGDLGKIVLPGSSTTVGVTTTVSVDNGCQNLTDAVTVKLQVNESLPA